MVAVFMHCRVFNRVDPPLPWPRRKGKSFMPPMSPLIEVRPDVAINYSKRWVKKYAASDLTILAFPSQEFGGQEFGTDKEISSFAASKNFPFAPTGVGVLMKLGCVKGDTASEIWKYMRENNSANNSKDPRWNFSSQYLVSKSGKVSIPNNFEQDIAALMAE